MKSFVIYYKKELNKKEHFIKNSYSKYPNYPNVKIFCYYILNFNFHRKIILLKKKLMMKIFQVNLIYKNLIKIFKFNIFIK